MVYEVLGPAWFGYPVYRAVKRAVFQYNWIYVWKATGWLEVGGHLAVSARVKCFLFFCQTHCTTECESIKKVRSAGRACINTSTILAPGTTPTAKNASRFFTLKVEISCLGVSFSLSVPYSSENDPALAFQSQIVRSTELGLVVSSSGSPLYFKGSP